MADSTLTLHARGPAVAVTEQEHDGMAVTETRQADLDVTVAVGADWLQNNGHVTKQGAAVRERDIAELVVDTLDHADVTYHAGHERHDEWAVDLGGSVDDWLTVAVEAADDVVSVGSDDKIATVACRILDDLADRGSDRPYLAILDLLARYDVSGFDREAVLADLAESAALGSDVPANREVEADV